MAYEMVFLERADLAKYQMYAQLVRLHQRKLTVSDIAKLMHMKYQAAYSVFQEIITDVETITGLPLKTVRQGLLTPEALPLSMDAYRAFLVRRSLLFQLIDCAVQATSPQLTTFLATHYVSRSTMTRKLGPCNKFLKHWGLRFRLAQMCFVGPEMSVRYFLFTLYWWTYRGLQWPFTTVRLADMQGERAALAVLSANELTQMEDHYFLAINHLRLSKHFRLPEHRFFDHLNRVIATNHMRRGTPPATVSMNTVAFFNFFELSVPRFDARWRTPETLQLALALLTTPETERVVDAIGAVADSIRPAGADWDLRLNLLRLTFGYLLLEAPFPQTQEYLPDGPGDAGNPGLEDALRQALEPMLEASVYADHLDELGGYLHQAAALLDPYLEEVLQTRRVRVQLLVAPKQPGYHQLDEFVNSVPWVAVTTADPGDVVVLDETTQPPARRTRPKHVIHWVENAIEIPAFRAELVRAILAVHQQLVTTVDPCASLPRFG